MISESKNIWVCILIKSWSLKFYVRWDCFLLMLSCLKTVSVMFYPLSLTHTLALRWIVLCLVLYNALSNADACNGNEPYDIMDHMCLESHHHVYRQILVGHKNIWYLVEAVRTLNWELGSLKYLVQFIFFSLAERRNHNWPSLFLKKKKKKKTTTGLFFFFFFLFWKRKFKI